ncbi:MAG: FKBP-type peptidyl-prolyl cis-trans isomerase [Woeseiaceae bacterium]|nr:FKBP-type peptidyl-prolyl cis-trans isomerase [Woeseiaceae bacterium]
MRPGIELLADQPGSGPEVRRRHVYLLRLKLWLNKGDPVRWASASGFVDRARLEDNGETLVADMRIDRENLVNGLFHGIQGMRIGGTRKLKIAPHLAYGARGVPGTIPENALIIAEVSVLEERVLARSDCEMI